MSYEWPNSLTQVFPVKMQQKLCRWYARRKHDHVHCVGGKLKE